MLEGLLTSVLTSGVDIACADITSLMCCTFGHKLTPSRQATIRSHSSSISTGNSSSSSKASKAASPSSSRPASSQRRNPSELRSLIANSRAELSRRALSSLVKIRYRSAFRGFPAVEDLVMPNKDRSNHEAPERPGGERWLYLSRQLKLIYFKPAMATVHVQ